MGTIERFPSPPLLPAVSRILSRFDREKLESFIEIAIDLADAMDGDPDLEDGNDREASDGDDRDVSWSEWHTRHWRARKAGREAAGCTPRAYPYGDSEDDEDDDPAGQCTEGEVSTMLALGYGRGAGCPISDPGEHDGVDC